MSAAELTTNASLAQVRRLEAVSFRAWPSTNTQYDGTWVLRLSAGHPSKRINSVNPLDRGDNRDIETRVERATQRFQSFGRPLIFRQTPLMPLSLIELLDQRGWSYKGESLVMTVPLASMDFSAAIEQLPFKDVGHWVDHALALRGRPKSHKPGLSELIDFIQPDKGLFLVEDNRQEPVATALCVHDTDMAGLFEVATSESRLRQGFARQLVSTSMQWAYKRGASVGWLQVEADNEPALNLYKSMGFSESYRYVYRLAPSEEPLDDLVPAASE